MSDIETEAPKRGRPRNEDRRERIPIGVRRERLGGEQRKGYRRRWFNDTPGRIDAAKAGGYDFVKDENGEPRAARVGVASDGQVQMGYLMEIPQEWYAEDQRAKMKPVDEFEAALKRGAPDIQGQDQAQGKLYAKHSSMKRD